MVKRFLGHYTSGQIPKSRKAAKLPALTGGELSLDKKLALMRDWAKEK